ncbi:MAG: hypothetical protein ABUL64_03555, partial [Singulisphaera sp.]
LALTYLGKAVELQPDRELYRNNIAMVLVEVGRPEDAVAQIAAVYGEPVAHYNVGVLLSQQGQPRLAAEQFAAAVRQDPAMQDAREWLARLNAAEAPRERLVAAEVPASDNQPQSASVTQARESRAGASSSRRAIVASRPVREPAPPATPVAHADATPAENAPAPPASPALAAPPATPPATPAADVQAIPASTPSYVPPSRY